MTAAIVLGFAAAAFLGAGLVLTQFGLRHIHPLSGAAISIPSFTVVFLLLSPILLRGDTIVWHAVPIFIAVGLVFPAVLTIITFASNRALGPVATGALGNLSPLLSVGVAVLLLHEPLRLLQFGGLMIAVLGVLTITVTRTADMRDWRTWALLLPLGSVADARLHSADHQDRSGNLAEPDRGGPDRLHFSTLTVLTVERIRTGRFIVRAPLAGQLWFAVNGICNGIGTLLLYAALGAGPVIAGGADVRHLSAGDGGAQRAGCCGIVRITTEARARRPRSPVGGVVLILAG